MANLYDKAGLVNIPVGYQEGFLYNIKPTDNTLAFRFNRDSAATRVNKEGLIEEVLGDKPRIDYTDSLTSPSFLLEPQSTNLQLRSQEFDNPIWTVQRATLTANDAISPDGTLNAYKLTHTSGTSGYVFDTIPTVNSGDSRLISVFAKYIDDEVFKIVTFTDSGYAEFNLLNGTVTSVSGTITDARIQNYGNGWYRCSCKYTATTTATRNYGFFLDDTSKEGVHIWGAQVEAENTSGYNGEYATSYIPTEGSTVTRTQETCNGAGSASTFNSTEGVLYAEIAALDLSETSIRRLGVTKNGTYEGVRLQLNNGSISATVYNGTTSQYSKLVNIDNSIFHKVALKYKTNDFALWIDGIEYHPQSSGSTFSDGTLDDISFDYLGANYFYGKVKGVYVFNEALTDDELQQLTT